MESKVTKTRKAKNPIAVYLLLIGISIGAIALSSNKKTEDKHARPAKPPIETVTEEKTVITDNNTQTIDLYSAELNRNEYDIRNLLISGDVNSGLIRAFDEVNDTSFGSPNEEAVLTNEKKYNMYLVNGELNYTSNLTRNQQLAIRNWVNEVYKINPNFDFRVLAKNIPKLTIKNSNINMFYEDDTSISINENNYDYILNHILYYVATNYVDYASNTNFSYSLDEVGYQSGIDGVDFGRGVCEMYATTYSTRINGVLPNNGNAQLLYNIEESLESIYGTQTVLDCSSGCNVKTFANLLAKNLPNEDAIRYIATLDELYIDNGKHTSLSDDLEKKLLINISRYDINILYERISDELTNIEKEDKKEEYIEYRANDLLKSLNKVFSNNPTFNEDDYLELLSEIDILKENLKNQIKKVQR